MKNNPNKPEFIKPELSVEELSIALYRTNQQLIETNKQLQESERMQIKLLSNLSHDLRSPLTTLRSYVEYLLTYDNLDKVEVFETLNQMHAKIITMEPLINDLLLISTLDSQMGDITTLKPVNIINELKTFFNSCKSDKKYSKRTLSLQLPINNNNNNDNNNDPYSIYVSLDSDLFQRALDNLFTNALKFSSLDDSITLSAHCSKSEITIIISDTGIGISEQYLNKIFDRSFMVSKARTPSNPGSFGLGLSITSQIIAKHNGKIWCSSSLGKGSDFYISLPILPPQIEH